MNEPANNIQEETSKEEIEKLRNEKPEPDERPKELMNPKGGVIRAGGS